MAAFIDDWIFTTNHRRLAILYFWFVVMTGFTGLVLATIIRLELAYPGKFFLASNAERYLTVISLHGIVMVFFVVIPVLFGAFGNFLLPTQLGIRDVAFPRLNSFMFWVTPAGFVLLLHILLFDRAYSLTYWANQTELKARLRRRYTSVEPQVTHFHERAEVSALALRTQGVQSQTFRSLLLAQEAPRLEQTGVDLWVALRSSASNMPSLAEGFYALLAAVTAPCRAVVTFGSLVFSLSRPIVLGLEFIRDVALRESWLWPLSPVTLLALSSALDRWVLSIAYTGLSEIWEVSRLPQLGWGFGLKVGLGLDVILEVSRLFITRLRAALNLFTLQGGWAPTVLGYNPNWGALCQVSHAKLGELGTHAPRSGTSVSVSIAAGQSQFHNTVALSSGSPLSVPTLPTQLASQPGVGFAPSWGLTFVPTAMAIPTSGVSWLVPALAWAAEAVWAPSVAVEALRTSINQATKPLNLGLWPSKVDSREDLPVQWVLMMCEACFLSNVAWLPCVGEWRLNAAHVLFQLNSFVVDLPLRVAAYLSLPESLVTPLAKGCSITSTLVVRLLTAPFRFYLRVFESALADVSTGWPLTTLWGPKGLVGQPMLFLASLILHLPELVRVMLSSLWPAESLSRAEASISCAAPYVTQAFMAVGGIPNLLPSSALTGFALGKQSSQVLQTCVATVCRWVSTAEVMFLVHVYIPVLAELDHLVLALPEMGKVFVRSWQQSCALYQDAGYQQYLLASTRVYRSALLYSLRTSVDFAFKPVVELWYTAVVIFAKLQTAPASVLPEAYQPNAAFFGRLLGGVQAFFASAGLGLPLFSGLGLSLGFARLTLADRGLYGLWVGAQSPRPWTPAAASSVPGVDYFYDWRELKLEREVWRSLDMLSMSRQQLSYRKKYYSDLFEPAAITSKVSTWMPNRLLAGWAFVTPYSSRLRYTALGKVDIALVVVFAASLGSVFSSINYVITYRYIGAPILKNRRELRSFFVDALLVGSRMMIMANPALLIGILLLLSDRHFNTSVFDFSGGGDTILFQHLFWFFGHPEVYIIIIPCFGFMNSLLPIYLRKRLSGRLSLQFSMYTIAFMGFAVWGHHMYMVGLANSVRTLYSTMTVMISVPASTKVLHWCVTLVQSTLVMDVGFLFLLNFMYFFVLGGLSGMFVAHIGFDTIFHDTFYVIGHFHVMLAGAAVSCIFAGFYFYFAAIFGVRYSRVFAYAHYTLYTLGQLLTLIPMFWLGFAGMPRRIMDYPSVFGGWHSLITSGHFLTVLSLVFFICMLVDSFYENRAPVARMRGVSRLNTRLAFYAYETRKLRFTQSRALVLAKPTLTGQAKLYGSLWVQEMSLSEYVFVKKV